MSPASRPACPSTTSFLVTTPRDRRAQGHGASAASPVRSRLRDLGVGDVPELEPSPGGRRPGRRRPAGAAGAERAAGPEREQVLLLGATSSVGAVDAEQRLARPHRLADEVDEDLLDEAGDLEVDVVDARLVHRHPADRAPARRPPWPLVTGAVRRPMSCCRCGSMPTVARPETVGVGVAHLVRVDRDVVHPHLVLSRDGGGLLRIHGRAVEEELALGGRPARRDELHPADGALARLVRGDAGVHRADVGGVGVGRAGDRDRGWSRAAQDERGASHSGGDAEQEGDGEDERSEASGAHGGLLHIPGAEAGAAAAPAPEEVRAPLTVAEPGTVLPPPVPGPAPPGGCKLTSRSAMSSRSASASVWR